MFRHEPELRTHDRVAKFPAPHAAKLSLLKGSKATVASTLDA